MPTGTVASEQIERFRDALTESDAEPDRQLDAVSVLASIGVTPLAGGAAPFDARRYRLGTDSGVVGGFIPGRHPVNRTELVVARIHQDDPGIPILMEATRVLVERSTTANVPGRSLLIAIAADSVRSVTAHLWPSASVAAHLEITSEGDDTVHARVVRPQSDSSAVELSTLRGDDVELATRLIEMLLHVASPADTLAFRDTPSTIPFQR